MKEGPELETGLSSRAKEPVLIIRTRLDFRPHIFEASKPQKKNNHTFLFLRNFFLFPHKVVHGSMSIYIAIFSPFLGTGNRERTRKTTSDRNEHSLSYNVSLSAFMPLRKTAKEDSSRCSPRFFHSCQPALKLAPNLVMSAGWASSSDRQLNRCRDKLLRYSFMSDTRAHFSSQRRIFITARITSLTRSSPLTSSPTFTSWTKSTDFSTSESFLLAMLSF